jgi:hypothetical protein
MNEIKKEEIIGIVEAIKTGEISDGNLPEMICPICSKALQEKESWEYMHIEGVRTWTTEYGTGVGILFHGECGHWWVLNFIPLKGRYETYNKMVFDKSNDMKIPREKYPNDVSHPITKINEG